MLDPVNIIPISAEDEQYLDSIENIGILTFGSLTKRISELLILQVQDLYKSQGIGFKPTWFPVLLALKKAKKMDVKTLAKTRRVTPSAISQVLKDLEKNKLVSIKPQENDLRQKEISLTINGEAIVRSLVPHLRLIERELNAIFGEEFEKVQGVLLKLENELTVKPLTKRHNNN